MKYLADLVLRRSERILALSDDDFVSLSLMPHAELDRYTYVHEGIAASMDALIELSNRMTLASAIAKRAPKGDYTSRDMEELITATSEAQGRLEYLTYLLRVDENGLNSALR